MADASCHDLRRVNPEETLGTKNRLRRTVQFRSIQDGVTATVCAARQRHDGAPRANLAAALAPRSLLGHKSVMKRYEPSCAVPACPTYASRELPLTGLFDLITDETV